MTLCQGQSTALSSSSTFVNIVTGENKVQYLGIATLKLWREPNRINQWRNSLSYFTLIDFRLFNSDNSNLER
jgi:hypothetical protein